MLSSTDLKIPELKYIGYVQGGAQTINGCVQPWGMRSTEFVEGLRVHGSCRVEGLRSLADTTYWYGSILVISRRL